MTSLRRSRRARLLAVCVAALTALPLVAAAGASAAPLTAARAPSPSGEDRALVRERTFPLDAELFRTLCTPGPVGVPRERTFEFFEDVRVTAVEDGIDDDHGTVVWSGHAKDRPDTSVVVALRGLCRTAAGRTSEGPVVVEVHADLGERVYHARSVPGRPTQLRVTEEDPFLRALRAPDKQVIDPASASALRRSLQGGVEATADKPVVIDVIAGYTPKAVATAGGQQQVINRIYWAERKMNEALADSNVPASIDILGTYNTNYQGDNTAEVMRGKLENPQDPDLGSRADELRRRFGADLVTVVNDTGTGSSGNASLPTRGNFNSQLAFSAVDFNSLISFYNLGHELGHNLGLFHDRDTLRRFDPTSVNNVNAPYGTGWVTPNLRHRTLMAYPESCLPQLCTVVNQYSNTENTFNGQPLGDANNNNAALARLSTPIVAGYRTLVDSRIRHALTVSSTEGGTIRPAVYGPYKPGTVVGVTARPDAGFRLAAWIYDGVQYDAAAQFNVTMDHAHTLRGVFLPLPTTP
ncbi:InlB B-repeat-containing protein [Streptomyces sp. NPDC002104]